ncbi:flavin reductase family protein [Amycolatopsis sp.]|jgi:flavin reductase (DIM6/NTAB) family NADH-FMN oxidoreductase RutF|uniref:flavin reductase family protein n=1 Tax=Amycolatopsis sp. TaxID=37632 RepID=UPI002E0C39C1|nr:flavin reductase family protein [Amycolatopsis sp.]
MDQHNSLDGAPGTTELVRLDTFRAVMATVCTPVSVITAMDGQRPHGTTVSAFASLSLEPPMVLVALALNSDLLRLVRATRRFGVNVLGRHQADLAQNFARKGEDKFDDAEWCLAGGVPRLTGAPGWLVCQVTELVPGGDHLVALGAVIEAETGTGAPLTYHERRFGTHAALEVA